MKTFLQLLVVMCGLFLFSNTYAHAPELHKKEGAEKPQCAALQKMDRSKLDKNDPVMQAMMKQCQDWLHDDHEEEESDKQQKKNKHHHD